MGSEQPAGQTHPEIEELRARLRAEEKKLARVQKIGQALSSALDLDRLLALVMDNITELMDAGRSTLYLLRDDGRELWYKVVQGGEVLEIHLKVGEGIAGWVAQSGETVNIPDAYSDTRFQPAVDLRSGYRTKSILCMPMRNNQGAIIGVVQVLNKQGGPFTAEDETLLAALASQAAVAIENSKLYQSMVKKNVELLDAKEKLQQRSNELNLLFEVEREMNAALNLDELLDRLLRRAMQLLGAEAGSIVLREKDEDLHFRSVAGRVSEYVKRVRVKVGEGIVGWVAANRIPLIVNDPENDPRHDRDLAESLGHVPRHILCAPIVAETDVLGAIELLDKKDSEKGFDDTDLKLLLLIAGQTSRAIQLSRAKEERLNQSRLASIGQMLSGMLHDLKTPMTIASGYAQLMAQIDEPEQREEFVELILKQFEHMSAMTREVLAFARGESNVLIRKVYLHKFFEEITEHLKHEFAGRNIELDLLPAYKGVAFFDQQKMLRVVHNIARNAAQAMPQGGTFTLRSEAVDGRLVFEFSDTGVGIPPEMEGRLFEAFSTSGKQEGTGLGLAIVKKIVEEHQGEISYRSTRGVGTTFRIEIPLERAEEGAKKPAA